MLWWGHKGTSKGSATEEELGRVTEYGKSRVPPACVPWERAQAWCKEHLQTKPDLVSPELPLAGCTSLKQYLSFLTLP